MAEEGKVGEASVDIIANIVVDEESLAQVGGQIQAALGKDASPRSETRGTQAKADVQIDPAKLHAKIVKAIENGDAFEIQLGIDAPDLRAQIASALKSPFIITLTAEVAGGQAVAGVGTTHGATVATGAPVSRGAPPQELAAMERKYRDVIENLYTQVASSIKGFGGAATGAGPLDKLAAVMQHFNVSKFEDLLQVDRETTKFPKAIGGALNPTTLQAQGLSEEAAKSLESAARAFTGTRENKYSDSEAGVLFARMNKWVQTPLVAQPAAAAQPVVVTTQPVASATRPSRVERTSADQEALRTELEEVVKEQALTREGIIAEGQRALRGRPLSTEAFATGPLDKSGTRGRGRGKERFGGLVSLAEGLTSVESLGIGAGLSPGLAEQLGQHPDFLAWLAENKAREDEPSTTSAQGRRARRAWEQSMVDRKIGMVDVSSERPLGPQPIGGVVPRQVGGRGRVSTRSGDAALMGEQAGGGRLSEFPDVVREDKLRQERLLGDWMVAKGLRPRGDVIRPAGATKEIDLEEYQRAAEAGEFEDVFERFEKERVKGADGKTKTLTVSRGLEKMEPTEIAGFAELQRQRGLKPKPRPWTDREGLFARVSPMEAMTRKIISDAGVEEDSASAASIREEVDARAIALRNSLQRGSRPLAPQGGIGRPGAGASDLGRLPKIVGEWQSFIDGEVSKLGTWIQTAETQLAGTKNTGARTAIEAKINRWRGFQTQWKSRQDELAGVADSLMGNASASDEQAIQMIRATHEAARARGEGLDSKGVVENMVGLNLREQASSEVGRGGRLSGQARGRMYNILQQLGMAPPNEDDDLNPSVQTLLKGRFLGDPTRRALPNGGVETMLGALKRSAFGETGKPVKKATVQNSGGLLQDLMTLMPEGTPDAQVSIVREGITDILKGYIGDQAARQDLAAQALDRKESTPRSLSRAKTTASAIVTDEGVERLAFDRQVTGEGQFKGRAPGIEGQVEALLERNRRIKDELEPMPPEGTEYPYSDPDAPGAGMDARDFLQTRSVMRAAEEAKARLARDKTIGKGSTVTGDQSQDIYRDAGVLMAEEGRPEPPFADLAAKLGYEAPPAPGRSGGGGGRTPRGRVADGPGDPGGPREPGGLGEVTGAIHVIVDNVPLQVTWAGAGPSASATASQRGIASASRGSWGMADLGAQTSPEFQDAYRMEVERLVKSGMDEKGIKAASKEAGLSIASTMFFSDRKRQADAAPIEIQPNKREVVSPQQRWVERRERAAESRYGKLFDQAIAEEEARKERFGSAPIDVQPTPRPVTSAQQRAAEAESKAMDRAEAERAKNRAAGVAAYNRALVPPESRSSQQETYEKLFAQRDREDDRVERARQAELRAMRRQAKINDPIGFGQSQDRQDELQRSMRGQLRSLNRRIPRRGFGASITDLVTSLVPGSGALERQLEAGDLAMREATEINQTSTKRAQGRTTRAGLIKEIRTERAEGRRGGERETALLSQYREQIAVGKSYNQVVRTATERFERFHNEATKATTVLKSFGAAAIGSVASTVAGAATFGIGAAITAGVSIGVVNGMEKILGSPSLRGETRMALGEGTQAAAGRGEIAVAQMAAQTGLAGTTLARLSPQLARMGEIEAGNQALVKQIGILKVAEETGVRGADAGTLKTLNGIMGTWVNGTMPAAEQMGDFLGGTNVNRIGTAEFQGFDGLMPKIGPAVDELEGDVDKFRDRVNAMNEMLSKAKGNTAEFADGMKFSREELDKQASELIALGAPRQLTSLIDSNITGLANKETGELLTGAEAVSAISDAVAALSKPEPSALLALQMDQIKAQEQMRQTLAKLNLDILQPAERGIQAAAEGPLLPATAGIDQRGLTRAQRQELAQTQSDFDEINADSEAGIQKAIDFVTNGFKQQQQRSMGTGGGGDSGGRGPYSTVGEGIGLGAEKGEQFATALKAAAGYSSQIAQIQIGIQTKQAAFAADQYSYSIGLAKRSLSDARALTGEIVGDTKNLGAIERQNFDLQRQSQSMGLQLSQRQINFQRAIAGFTAPGLTGEERAARIQQAKIEADYAQKQLNIQKQLFGLSGRSFEIQASRQVTDLLGNINLMEQGRSLVIDIAIDEKKMAGLAKRRDRELKTVQQIYSDAVNKTNDIITLTGNLAAATGRDMGELANDVIQAYVKVYRGLIAEVSRSIRNLPYQGGEGPTEGGGGDSGGRGPTNAEGRVGMVSGETSFGDLGVMGEAGGEAFAILRDPQKLMTPLSGGGGTTIQIIVSGNKFASEDEEDRVMRKITQAVKDAQDRDFALRGLRN